MRKHSPPGVIPPSERDNLIHGFILKHPNMKIGEFLTFNQARRIFGVEHYYMRLASCYRRLEASGRIKPVPGSKLRNKRWMAVEPKEHDTFWGKRK